MWNEATWTLQFIVGSLFILVLLLPIYGLGIPIIIELFLDN